MNRLRQLLLTLVAASAFCSVLPVASALTSDEARHVLHRVGYGVTPAEWAQIIDLPRDAVIDLLIEEATGAATLTPPSWVSEQPLYTISQRGWSEVKRKELRIRKRALMSELRVWWLQQMITTEAPLSERMVMFWSNHFTTEFNKVRAPMLIYQQHALIREHAMGDFDRMLHAMLRDPAMLLYLDNDKNNRDKINENLARELMELFTLGEGNYTEDDVKEAARALTGWGVDRKTGEFVQRKKRHDTGRKNVLGKTAKFDGQSLADWLLQQSPTAERIVTKLWLEFISLEPDPARVREWAADWQQRGYSIDSLLRAMFNSDEFWAPENRGALIKSPTELYAGLIRPALHGRSQTEKIKLVNQSRPGKRLESAIKKSGQQLFNPPSVKGWPGGLVWLDSRTLLMREHTVRNLVIALAGGTQDYSPYATSIKVNDALDDSGPLVNLLMWHINALPPVTDIPSTMTPRRALLEIARDPTVHLK